MNIWISLSLGSFAHACSKLVANSASWLSKFPHLHAVNASLPALLLLIYARERVTQCSLSRARQALAAVRSSPRVLVLQDPSCRSRRLRRSSTTPRSSQALTFLIIAQRQKSVVLVVPKFTKKYWCFFQAGGYENPQTILTES